MSVQRRFRNRSKPAPFKCSVLLDFRAMRGCVCMVYFHKVFSLCLLPLPPLSHYLTFCLSPYLFIVYMGSSNMKTLADLHACLFCFVLIIKWKPSSLDCYLYTRAQRPPTSNERETFWRELMH